MTEPMKHGRKPPSSLQRLALCPGSARQCEGIADTAGADAELGTMLHGEVAQVLNAHPGRIADDDGLYAAARTRCGLPAHEHDYAVENILAFVDRLESTWFTGGQRKVEEQLDLTSIHPEVELGTADYIRVRPFVKAFAADWKFTHVDVPPARDNLQLRAYAVGVWRKYEVHEVEVALVNGFSGWGTRWKYAEADLEAAEKQLRAIVDAACIPWAPLVPSPEACRYCRASATCPGLLDAVANAQAGELRAEANGGLSPSELAKLMIVAEKVEVWCKAIKAQAWKLVQAGGRLPGWMLAAGRPTRAWADGVTIAQLQDIAERLNKDPNSAFKVEPSSPSQIEKAWGKAKTVREALASLIVQKPGSPKLVQEKEGENATQQG